MFLSDFVSVGNIRSSSTNSRLERPGCTSYVNRNGTNVGTVEKEIKRRMGVKRGLLTLYFVRRNQEDTLTITLTFRHAQLMHMRIRMVNACVHAHSNRPAHMAICHMRVRALHPCAHALSNINTVQCSH